MGKGKRSRLKKAEKDATKSAQKSAQNVENQAESRDQIQNQSRDQIQNQTRDQIHNQSRNQIQNQSRDRNQRNRQPSPNIGIEDRDVQKFLGDLKDSFDGLIGVAQFHLKWCEDRAQVDEVKDSFEPQILELIRMEKLIVHGTIIGDDTFSKYFDVTENEQPREICEKLDDLGKLVKEKTYDHIYSTEFVEELKTNPKYLKWLEMFENLVIEGDSDPEEQVSSDEDYDLPTRDPFTQNVLKDPVRNSLCGHIYSLSVIIAFLNKKQKIRCPYEGCKNINMIDSTHLVHDMSVKEKIQRIIAKAKNTGTKSADNARASTSNARK